ncbi:hypothetical protein RvY_07921 [Ramazzottius varieornatus]|uniref:Uncharacterized protein n=1 Tax=Ramazzottius varieornatus TaxID=947166 RepID=A0A1D1V6S1_RAMVA|nr:hypothetical protein RvY_07921 [Ramazzottius varieornatus]
MLRSQSSALTSVLSFRIPDFKFIREQCKTLESNFPHYKNRKTFFPQLSTPFTNVLLLDLHREISGTDLLGLHHTMYCTSALCDCYPQMQHIFVIRLDIHLVNLTESPQSWMSLLGWSGCKLEQGSKRSFVFHKVSLKPELKKTELYRPYGDRFFNARKKANGVLPTTVNDDKEV